MLDKTSYPYGAGFRSLTAETLSPVALAVTGELPAWLEGTLLRTAPSKFEVGARSYNHWFDGLAMLHRFAFAQGRVTYANRFLQSQAFRAAQATGEISYAEFATDPCRTLFGRVAALFDPKLTDNCNVNVVSYAGAPVALTETTMPLRFAPDTLATLSVFAYAPELRGQISMAHPHYDAARHCQYSYMVEFGMESRYRVFSIGDDGAQALVAELPVERPAYMHSFAMTENYLILAEFPLTVSALDLKFSGKPFITNYRWQPERGLKFRVIEKTTGREVAAPAGHAAFAFHHVNAFEDGDALLIDMIAYPDDRHHRPALSEPASRRRAARRHWRPHPLPRVARRRRRGVAQGAFARAARTAPHQRAQHRQALSLCLGHRHCGARRLPRRDRQD